MKKIIFLIFFILLNTIFADIVFVDPFTKVENITPKIEYFFDKKSKYSLKNIIENEKNLFKKSNKNKLLFGYEYDSTLWIKVKFKNISNQKVTKILEYDYPIQEYILFYDLNSKKILKSGYLNKKPPVKYITHPIKLTFSPYETKTLLIKAKDKNVGLIAKLNLWDTKEFEISNENRKLINILFLGGMIALIIYNIFLFFLTKDVTYFYYVVMVSSFLIIELFVSGFFPLYIENFFLNKTDIYILLLIMAFSMIFFTSNFLDLENKFPKIYNFLNIVTAFIFILFALNLTDMASTTFQRLTYMILFFVLVFIAIYAYIKGIKQAKYYLFGWVLLLVSAVLLALNQAGFANWIDNFPYIGKVSIFSEAILFSMALSARINAIKDEKERATRLLLEQRERENIKLEEYAEQKTKELRYALEEKDVLLKELHHRVKNNLQIIISLIRLQSDKIDDERLNSILIQSENRIRALSSVHELLYKSSNIAEIDAKLYLDILINEISYSLNYQEKIKVFIISNAKLSMDKAIYCGLIINELVTNAFKHAFKNKKNGVIEVSLIEKPEEYELIIRDNGVGIKNIESFKKNLGLQLVTTLVKKQLKGNIEIEGDFGTAYYINFKKS